MAAQDASGLVHQACLYCSDEQLLAAAAPFAEEGLARGEPVLIVTTSANLALLRHAVGDRAHRLDYAETAYLGRRAPQRVAAFYRYWQRHADSAGYVRILAEPVWTGRSEQEIVAWKRMESILNVVLSEADIWMVCLYDARVADPGVIADARRTHPACLNGRAVEPCADFVDPGAFARACDEVPLPDPPAGAATLRSEGDLSELRRFVAERAAAHGLEGERMWMLVAAVNEAAAYLLAEGSGAVTVRTWDWSGDLVYDLHDRGARVTDPFLGFRPPRPGRPEPAADDGLWLARQVCDALEVRSTDGGSTLRLHLPGPHAEEMLQPATAAS
ncbi:MAG TPA: sensor histidine kinase [Actinomycetes bacterium]|jgi:anti-sigma regulatory factor (Ser/Thr protein kinase)|nr:sensor histidine kinase [Actinomycetes bacterium]